MNNKDTSESFYELPKQPRETCPIIDDGLKALKNMMDNKPRDRYVTRAEEDELRSMLESLCGDIDYYSESVEDSFEACRQQAIDLREWGQSWKDLAKDNLDKVESIDGPWDGVMLWWNEKGEDYYHSSWIYRICFGPRHYNRNIKPVII